MTDESPVDPELLERARHLSEAAGGPYPPYPSREATDPLDAGFLHALELLHDPEWIARNLLSDDGGGGAGDR